MEAFLWGVVETCGFLSFFLFFFFFQIPVKACVGTVPTPSFFVEKNGPFSLIGFERFFSLPCHSYCLPLFSSLSLSLFLSCLLVLCEDSLRMVLKYTRTQHSTCAKMRRPRCMWTLSTLLPSPIHLRRPSRRNSTGTRLDVEELDEEDLEKFRCAVINS